MKEHAERSDLFRRVAEWMESRRSLDPVGQALLEEVRAEIPGKRGAKPKLTPDEARELIEQHGNAEAAARAHGDISGQRLRVLSRE